MSKSTDARRQDRIAARANERRGDAELDKPILTEIRDLASGTALSEMIAKLKGLNDSVIVGTAGNGLALAPQIKNLEAVAKNIAVITEALIADADAALKD